MYDEKQQKQLKLFLFLLAGSKFLATIILIYFYFNSKNFNYLPMSIILASVGFGLIYLYYKKVKVNE
ncbi:MAG: hypothetical protein NTW25_01085 [Candidatus Kapabacteria bacterium]|nr:hypothetical protein [Candidatus Kapabacteria bacterium]